MNKEITVKFTFLFGLAATILAVASPWHVAEGGETPQIIVLKLDDVVAYQSQDGSPVSPRWQRITDFLKERGIKASYGIIGFSLEEMERDNTVKLKMLKGKAERSAAEKEAEERKRLAAAEKAAAA